MHAEGTAKMLALQEGFLLFQKPPGVTLETSQTPLQAVWAGKPVHMRIRLWLSSRMKEEIGVENFDRYKETLFLNNWKDAVGRAGSDGDDRDLIIEVQVRGVCVCGVLKRDVDEGERK